MSQAGDGGRIILAFCSTGEQNLIKIKVSENQKEGELNGEEKKKVWNI